MPADKGQSPHYKPRADFQRPGRQIEAAKPTPAVVHTSEELGAFLLHRANLAELEVYTESEGKAELAQELAKMLFKETYSAGVDASELTQAYLENRDMPDVMSVEQPLPTLYVVNATPLDSPHRRSGIGA